MPGGGKLAAVDQGRAGRPAQFARRCVVSYFFLQEVGLIGKPLTFWIYGALGAAATVFIWLRVPETKGKSLEQIESEVGAA